MIFQDISNILIKFGQHGNLYEYCYSIQQGSCQQLIYYNCYDFLKYFIEIMLSYQTRLTKRNKVSVYKLSMWNGWCEHSLCARAPRARQGSCRVWQKSNPRRLSSMKKHIKCCENKHNRTRSLKRVHAHEHSCNHSRKHNCVDVSK